MFTDGGFLGFFFFLPAVGEDRPFMLSEELFRERLVDFPEKLIVCLVSYSDYWGLNSCGS